MMGLDACGEKWPPGIKRTNFVRSYIAQIRISTAMIRSAIAAVTRGVIKAGEFEENQLLAIRKTLTSALAKTDLGLMF
jgi:hypothetical protein